MIWIYVQHLLGYGHLRRALSLARALADAGFAVRLVSGGMPLAEINTDGIDFVQLPPVRVASAAFGEWLDERGRVVSTDGAWLARRREALLQSLRAIEPRLLIVEFFPFGRRAFRFELLPLLEYAHGLEPRPAVVSSVRDIVQGGRKPQRIAETVAWANRYLDAVWVHGDPALAGFGESFGAVAELTAPLCYTGYLYTPAPLPAGAEGGEGGAGAGGGEGADEVVVSAGGGPTGFALYRTALMAARADTGGRRWRVLLGAHYDEDKRAQLAALTCERSVIEDNSAIFPLLLQRCAVSVSRAGYNTVLDLLHHRARAVLVPFEDHGETEQLLRAQALARRRRAVLLREQALSPLGPLSPDTLLAAVAAALRGPRPAPTKLRTNGAQACVKLVRAILPPAE